MHKANDSKMECKSRFDKATHTVEVNSGKRFAFGSNWASFLNALTEDNISEAQHSLELLLGATSLAGHTMLDIGSGSGLFSLAARRMGAKVTSFDFDPQSVACTTALKNRYFPEDPDWTILEGSALDEDWVASLGSFSIVYSWGVLHHTGDLWGAMDIASRRVLPAGLFAIALYNDQGLRSSLWRFTKRLYCRLPGTLRWLILLPCAAILLLPSIIRDFLYLRPFHTWRHYHRRRGMSQWHDLIDWVGGFPFEVCTPEDVLLWGRQNGYTLERMTTVGGRLGCNQFTLKAPAPPALSHRTQQ